MCRPCHKRLSWLLRRLGFTWAEHGGWERVTPRGRIGLDLNHEHHTRFALLALVTRLVG